MLKGTCSLRRTLMKSFRFSAGNASTALSRSSQTSHGSQGDVPPAEHGDARVLQDLYRSSQTSSSGWEQNGAQDLGPAAFKEGLRRFLNGVGDDEMEALFRRYDADGSGRVSMKEFSDAVLAPDENLGKDGAFVRGSSADQKGKAYAGPRGGTKALASGADKTRSRVFGTAGGAVMGPEDWAAMAGKFPVRSGEPDASRRQRMFRDFDPNGNGCVLVEENGVWQDVCVARCVCGETSFLMCGAAVRSSSFSTLRYLSLAEVDLGVKSVLESGALFDAKPAIMRAFQAAKGSQDTTSRLGADFIERSEFRFLLLYVSPCVYFSLCCFSSIGPP